MKHLLRRGGRAPPNIFVLAWAMHPMVGKASCFVRSWNKKWKEYLSQKDVGATTPTAKSNTHTHTDMGTNWRMMHPELERKTENKKIKIRLNLSSQGV